MSCAVQHILWAVQDSAAGAAPAAVVEEPNQAAPEARPDGPPAGLVPDSACEQPSDHAVHGTPPDKSQAPLGSASGGATPLPLSGLTAKGVADKGPSRSESMRAHLAAPPSAGSAAADTQGHSDLGQMGQAAGAAATPAAVLDCATAVPQRSTEQAAAGPEAAACVAMPEDDAAGHAGQTSPGSAVCLDGHGAPRSAASILAFGRTLGAAQVGPAGSIHNTIFRLVLGDNDVVPLYVVTIAR